VSELDATRLVERQELHGITIDELDLRELDGNDTALLERSAKDFQVLPGNPPTDAQNDTLFNRTPIDSASHARVACSPAAPSQTGRHTSSLKMPHESDVPPIARW
jgi:hypothetical protein